MSSEWLDFTPFGVYRQSRSELNPEFAKRLAEKLRKQINYSEAVGNLIHDSVYEVLQYSRYSEIEPEVLADYTAAEMRASLEHYFRVEAAKHDARLAKINNPDITL